MTQESGITGYVPMDVRHNVFFSLLTDYAPLFILGFSLCFLKGLTGLRAGYMGKTVLAMAAGLIIQSTIGAAIAVGIALLLPLAHINPDPMTMIGVVVFITVCGLRSIDALVYKKLGIHMIDVSSYTKADKAWMELSEEDREKCMEAWKKEQSDGE